MRQHGNLSFTRVYEAGHEVPAYQPETAYKLFMRALFNRDLATGNVSTLEHADYATVGAASVADIKSEGVVDPGSVCYVLDSAQCTADQWKTVEDGTALVKNWIVVDGNSSYLFPELFNGTANGTAPGSPSPSSTGPAFSNGANGVVGGSVRGVVSVLLASVVGGLML